ncbi:cytochrome P450 [Streptomyces sp. NPDC002004]
MPHTALLPDASAVVPLIDITATGPGPTPLQQAMELTRRHGSAFVRRLHGRDALFVSDLDLVTELADETRFAKHVGPALENVREFTADGLFTAYNDEPNWARAHDILMPAFALGSMRTYHPVMLRVARRLLESWDRDAAAGHPVDVPGDMTRMTLDTIGLAGFGYDFGSFGSAEPHPFVESMVRCLEWSMKRLSRTPGGDHAAADAAFRADAGYLSQVVDEVITARTDAADAEGPAEDLLGLMLTARHPDGSALDTANIRNQVITFLIAGHETTSGAMSFALYYLAKHPVALELVRREVDALWGGAADPEPTFEEVGRLTYTRQVLNEALRLWPTAAAFSRQAREDTLLGGRIPLKAGQGVTVLTPMLHRQPVWGDNPGLFDPSRFTPEAEAARSPHAFKPFGTGERACIGRQFALHEATMLLGLIVHRYRLSDHADYRLTVKETLTLKPDGFTLALAPRTTGDRTHTPLPGAAAPLSSGRSASTDALPARVRPGTGLLLLHGSNYGTCRGLAEQLADEAAALGCDTAVAPLDSGTDALPADRPVVVVAASYNGRPTDDAAAFASWLRNAPDGTAADVTYAVLGVGDRNWAATYQHVPTFFDDRLAELGATRLTDRAAADASGDMGGTVRDFTARLRTALLERYGDPEATDAAHPADADDTYDVRELTGGPLDAVAARHGLVSMKVTDAHDLTAPGHPRTKRFLRVELPEGGGYRTGDHLTVLPVNASALVERAAAAFGVALDTVLDIRARRPRRDGPAVDRPLTVRELLRHHVELADRPTPRQVALLAAANPCPPERAALGALPEDDPRSLVELVEDHPALRGALDWQLLLGLLPPLRPRHYSVSSSPSVRPGHVDLMVSLLEGPARSGRGRFRGAGSGHLAAVRPGDTVLARVQPCREDFRIAHDTDTPVIMIGAGTGLAPFRGAVADRGALVADGAALAPALLYFGCDHPDGDFLHAAELHAAEAAGAVRVRPAFSDAPTDGVSFVQHRIAADADEVWALLTDGARVYVCGDGARMAPGVRDAFRTLFRDRTPGADAGAAETWLKELVAEGRYVEDVYAG